MVNTLKTDIDQRPPKLTRSQSAPLIDTYPKTTECEETTAAALATGYGAEESDDSKAGKAAAGATGYEVTEESDDSIRQAKQQLEPQDMK